MKIGGILDISTIDFPGKVCSVIFLSGCPFRCPYCHNYELLYEGENVSIEKIVKNIERNYLIDGVCITGGEPFMQDIEELAKELKDIGLAVKVDTNGYYPNKLEKALKYIDYIAIDVKTSPKKYPSLTGREDSWERVKKSLEILKDSNVEWEIRTTVVSGLVWIDELLEIRKYVKANVNYILQQFRNEKVLDASLKKVRSPSIEELKNLAIKSGYDLVRCAEGEFYLNFNFKDPK